MGRSIRRWMRDNTELTIFLSVVAAAVVLFLFASNLPDYTLG